MSVGVRPKWPDTPSPDGAECKQGHEPMQEPAGPAGARHLFPAQTRRRRWNHREL